jgi:uncharacterized protein with NRDE domain
MCVAALAWAAHPDWLLVAAANRDEYHDRPAAPLAPWPDGQDILAGRDLRSGGTWLGISGAGRFALVTNRRGHGDPDPSRPSRGKLVTDLLDPRIAPESHAPEMLEQFNPFNVLAADPEGVWYLGNRPRGVRAALGHGVYGLSNGALDEPWPKTLGLKAALVDWLAAGACEPDALFAALASERLDDIGLHPDGPSDIPAEAPETPVFIRDPVYGTRCSTVVMIDRTGRGRIIERRFDGAGAATGETALDFAWPAAPR